MICFKIVYATLIYFLKRKIKNMKNMNNIIEETEDKGIQSLVFGVSHPRNFRIARANYGNEVSHAGVFAHEIA